MASVGLTAASRKSLAMGPSVRNLLRQYQLNPNQIVSTGPHQTLIKSDVLAHVSKHQLQPAKEPAAQATETTSSKGKVFVPNLDISGHQPKAGEISNYAKRLLGL